MHADARAGRRRRRWRRLRARDTLQGHSPGSDPTSVNQELADALRDRYVLQRELGRGGMATVYLARDLRHDRPVALKVLHPELAHALGPERFIREIRLAARLDECYGLVVAAWRRPDRELLPFVAEARERLARLSGE